MQTCSAGFNIKIERRVVLINVPTRDVSNELMG
jgi:hypothetical protein